MAHGQVLLSALSLGPGCPEASTLSHPQPGRLGERAVEGIPPNDAAVRVASEQPLHNSGPGSGWSVSGSLGRTEVKSQESLHRTPSITTKGTDCARARDTHGAQ